MMWWGHGSWDAGDWVAMSLMMVLFWGLLIALVVRLVGSSRDRRGPLTGQLGQTQRADDVLAERFARGEIDETEFARSSARLHTSSDRS